nr:MAG TPA: hypothetical protein [Caudoviricetes sp.]
MQTMENLYVAKSLYLSAVRQHCRFKFPKRTLTHLRYKDSNNNTPILHKTLLTLYFTSILTSIRCNIIQNNKVEFQE